MVALRKTPPTMDLAEFLAWDAPPHSRWQLVDGEPRAMAPASVPHNIILAQLGRLIGNHLEARNSPCIAIPNSGVVPRARSRDNYRIPDLVVACSGIETDDFALSEPVLLAEILSPSNQAETWTNIWAYLTIPSLREVLVLRSTAIGAEVLRRAPDGTWPDRPLTVTEGVLELESIGFQVELAALYARTRLARG
jgi:Uma2 family endonuclease